MALDSAQVMAKYDNTRANHLANSAGAQAAAIGRRDALERMAQRLERRAAVKSSLARRQSAGTGTEPLNSFFSGGTDSLVRPVPSSAARPFEGTGSGQQG